MRDEPSTGDDSEPSDAPGGPLADWAEPTLCPFGSVEYSPEERAYRATFDADAVGPSTAVVGAVSAVVGADPTELAPLYATVDPDALDALVGGRHPSGHVSVSFTLAGHDVTLSAGRVVVRPTGPVETDA